MQGDCLKVRIPLFSCSTMWLCLTGQRCILPFAFGEDRWIPKSFELSSSRFCWTYLHSQSYYRFCPDYFNSTDYKKLEMRSVKSRWIITSLCNPLLTWICKKSTILGRLLAVVNQYKYLISSKRASDDALTDKWDLVLLGGFVGSLFSFLQFLVSPYIGKISDSIGRRKTLLLTMVR